jgi:hypothetical protein
VSTGNVGKIVGAGAILNAGEEQNWVSRATVGFEAKIVDLKGNVVAAGEPGEVLRNGARHTSCDHTRRPKLSSAMAILILAWATKYKMVSKRVRRKGRNGKTVTFSSGLACALARANGPS